MFLHLSVILSTGGVSAPVHAGMHTPRQIPPWADTPPRQTHPPGRHPPGRWLLLQMVGILLECILFTVRKVCEGYVFTPVCQSFCSRGGHAWLGGCAWLWGACVVVGGMRSCRGHAWLRGACMVAGACVVARGACVVVGGACMVVGGHAWDTMRYGQWAGGTHPTGMHSCSIYFAFVATTLLMPPPVTMIPIFSIAVTITIWRRTYLVTTSKLLKNFCRPHP